MLHMVNVHHKTVALEDLKKDEADASSGLEMEQQEFENEGVGGEGLYVFPLCIQKILFCFIQLRL